MFISLKCFSVCSKKRIHALFKQNYYFFPAVKPHNPMVNSGSIIVNSLLQTLMKPDMTSAEKFDEINNYIKRMAGDEYVSFNNSVFLAEREVSDRNYALSYYMKENNCFPKGK